MKLGSGLLKIFSEHDQFVIISNIFNVKIEDNNEGNDDDNDDIMLF